jgi:hypothetical protein
MGQMRMNRLNLPGNLFEFVSHYLKLTGLFTSRMVNVLQNVGWTKELACSAIDLCKSSETYWTPEGGKESR